MFNSCRTDPAAVFQFQMVRLKAENITYEQCQTEFQFQMVRLKENLNDNIDLLLILFQFQMVRLKGEDANFQDPIEYISIPDGTIKRIIV